MIFDVFQQQPMLREGTGKLSTWRSQLSHVGTVNAATPEGAIRKAKDLVPFKIADRNSLARYPIVQQQGTQHDNDTWSH